MNTKQINNHFKKYDCYIGTFSCDRLPNTLISKRPIALIMNTDPVTKPGQHWVAIYIDKCNDAEYFDSFDFPPLNKEVYEFMTNQRVNSLTYNRKQIQDITTTTCGHHCVIFIKLRCHDITLREILFLNFNDKNIKKII
jgi:hypothetical protein